MTTLDDLKKVGALKSSWREVSVTNLTTVSFSDFKAMTNEERVKFSGIVTVDDYSWVATTQGLRPSAVNKIASGNGLLVGVYDRQKKEFFLKRYVDRKLASIDNVKTNLDIQHKEVEHMEKETMDVLSAFGEDALSDLKVEAQAKEEHGVDPQMVDPKAEEINQIKAKVSGQQLVDRRLVVSKNQKHGRLIGFVTKTNATIKLTKRQTVKKVSGKEVLDPSAPSDIKAKWDQGDKVANKWLLKRADIAFRHANPGAIVGVVIATPADGEINLNTIQDADRKINVGEDVTLKYRFFPIEEAYVIIAAWYNGNIREYEPLLGEKASYITQKYIPVISKNEEGAHTPTFRVRLQQNSAVRSSLLCPENYFPLKTFVTIDYQNLTEEDARILNYNIEAMLKNDQGNELLGQFNESDPERVVKTADGVTSKLFYKGASAGPDTCGDIVPFYDKKGAPLREIAIAARDKKESKNKPGVFTYPFSYRAFDEEGGSLENPVHKQVFDAFQIPLDEFKDSVSKATSAKRTSKKNKPTISTDDYLKALSIGGMVQGSTASFADIQNAIDGNIFN